MVTHYNHTAKTILMSTKIYGDFLFFNSFLNEMEEKTVMFLLKCILFQTKAPNSRVLAWILKIGVKRLISTNWSFTILF